MKVFWLFILLEVIKFFGILLINIGLNMFTNYIPVNILADIIIYVGMLILTLNVKFDLKRN